MHTLSIVTKRVAALAKGVIVMGVAVFGWGTAAAATEIVAKAGQATDKVELVKVDMDKVASSIKRVLSGQAAEPSIPEIGAPVQFALTGLPFLMPASLPGVRTRTKVSRAKTEKKGKALVTATFYHTGGGQYERNPSSGTGCAAPSAFPCQIIYHDADDVEEIDDFVYLERPDFPKTETANGVWQ